jgi:hypothetical protein
LLWISKRQIFDTWLLVKLDLVTSWPLRRPWRWDGGLVTIFDFNLTWWRDSRLNPGGTFDLSPRWVARLVMGFTFKKRQLLVKHLRMQQWRLVTAEGMQRWQLVVPVVVRQQLVEAVVMQRQLVSRVVTEA